MTALPNDVWRGEFTLEKLGRYRYTVTAWVDHFLSWRNEFKRRVDPADIASAALVGAKLIAEAANRAARGDAHKLREWGKQPDRGAGRRRDQAHRARRRAGGDRAALSRPPLRSRLRARARRSSSTARARASRRWYELFPRSASPEPGRHGTLARRRSAPALRRRARLRRALPAADPSDRARRSAKARTMRSTPAPDDVGSPWAIGSDEGGHKAIHPELGTLEDFRRLVASARELGIDIALDIAFQCAPDHPVREGASGVVHVAARRHGAVRREPAEEIPGHLSVQFRVATTGRRCGKS